MAIDGLGFFSGEGKKEEATRLRNTYLNIVKKLAKKTKVLTEKYYKADRKGKDKIFKKISKNLEEMMKADDIRNVCEVMLDIIDKEEE